MFTRYPENGQKGFPLFLPTSISTWKHNEDGRLGNVNAHWAYRKEMK